MAEEGPSSAPLTNPQLEQKSIQETPIEQPASHVGPLAQAEDRTDLLAKARAFLVSPQVIHQDSQAKRVFLREKGLNPSEIENLLQELPPQPPSIPPRTYPQVPPSNLPILLLGLVRLFSWLAGGSAALLFLYHRFLLPRIAQTSVARHSLKTHQTSLLRQLIASLSSLKESQSEAFSVLPRPDPFNETSTFVKCRKVADIFDVLGEKEPNFTSIPAVTLLRCAISDFGRDKDEKDAKPTTEELFRYLEDQIPWLATEEGLQYEQALWDSLSTCPLFKKVTLGSGSLSLNTAEKEGEVVVWEYHPLELVPPPPLVQSLDALASELPKLASKHKKPFQHALQSLSDFTGYISTQVYLPYRPSSIGSGIPGNLTQTSVEDEMRREIRALKGLVLNRRSFMPSIPRPSYSSSSHPVAP